MNRLRSNFWFKLACILLLVGAAVLVGVVLILSASAGPPTPETTALAGSRGLMNKKHFPPAVDLPSPSSQQLSPLPFDRNATPLLTALEGMAQSGGIYGRVTYNESAASNVPLALRMYDSTSETTVQTATTDVNGEYVFADVSSLPVGKTYYVRYGPNSADSRYVAAWYSYDITFYTEGDYVHGSDFDIANIALQSPPSGATRSVPTDFTWTKRNPKTDSYRWALFDPDPDSNARWFSALLGYVGQFTLDSLPDGVELGKQYGWYMVAYEHFDTFGISFYYRPVTFSSVVVTPMPQSCPLKGDFDGSFEITVRDIQQVAARWRARAGDSNYGPVYDLDNNDVININTFAKLCGDGAGFSGMNAAKSRHLAQNLGD